MRVLVGGVRSPLLPEATGWCTSGKLPERSQSDPRAIQSVPAYLTHRSHSDPRFLCAMLPERSHLCPERSQIAPRALGSYLTNSAKHRSYTTYRPSLHACLHGASGCARLRSALRARLRQTLLASREPKPGGCHSYRTLGPCVPTPLHRGSYTTPGPPSKSPVSYIEN